MYVKYLFRFSLPSPRNYLSPTSTEVMSPGAHQTPVTQTPVHRAVSTALDKLTNATQSKLQDESKRGFITWGSEDEEEESGGAGWGNE